MNTTQKTKKEQETAELIRSNLLSPIDGLQPTRHPFPTVTHPFCYSISQSYLSLRLAWGSDKEVWNKPVELSH
jgi:hypothetical protein